MKKSLFIHVTVLFFVLFVFIFSIKITENVNMNKLRNSPSQVIELNEKGRIELPSVSINAINYRKINLNIWEVNLTLSFLIPILFLITGCSAKLRNFAKRKGKNTFCTIAIYFFFYSLLNLILTFPINLYSSFFVKHSFKLSNVTFLRWITETIKSFSISTATGIIFILIPYFIIKHSPKRWWLYLGLSSIPIIMAITFISPTYIDPIFNKYEPIKNESLKKAIYKELDKANLNGSKVLQVNKSKDTNEMNAYMTGIFGSKRIVLWDTTINNLTEKETLSVTAHEIGHFVLGHIWKGIILGGIFTTILLYFIYKTAHWILNKWGNILKFNCLHDIAALPLIILLMNMFVLLSSPISNTYSRHIERQADTFQLELTQDNLSAITSTIKLHEKNLALPRNSKLYEIWFCSHPSYYDRIEFAKNYAPWKDNQCLKYSDYIKQ